MGAKSLSFAALVGFGVSGLAGCGKATDQVTENRSDLPSAALPAKPVLNVAPRALDKHRVEFTITTNMPLPIQVATSVDLVGQKGQDVYIGYQGEHVTLNKPSTVVILDTALADKPLPAADYEASVNFYPKWGAEGNALAASAPPLEAKVVFKLDGSGGTAKNATLLRERQKWVMLNVIARTPWDKADFERRLGKAEKRHSDMSHLHDAYYFPGADMTLIVNRLKNEVTVWRLGQETK
ncbi:hypothetical protein C8J42_102532 [Sphingomonas sp. PP-CE-1A-559]|uniref:hypothetical protein n=1 Tax=Sphingomonas sp. PP-CE-1A-559 TaxID=2135657 RepID=UPI001055D184|nr:hypothetical protein [Sphingomonas sp. PP-CE-1A-559]TCP92756.1 hypothetical protein C8J42_102532 [Sphingomonas sp. PP-CE-1A-559]